MAPPKRGKAPLIAGIVGGLLILGGIVVLVLFLAVWRGGGGGTGEPAALAEKYMNAMEKGDAQAYMDCFEPEFFSMEDNPIMEGMDIDIKKLLEMSFQLMDMKFIGVELKVESQKGDSATVVTTAGTMRVSAMGMEEEVDLAEDPLKFDMVKDDGRWYLTEDPTQGMVGPQMDLKDQDTGDFNPGDLNPGGLNPEDLIPRDLNPEDLENLNEEDLNRLMQELEQWMQEEGIPQEDTTTDSRGV
jgi:hypothetical protein